MNQTVKKTLKRTATVFWVVALLILAVLLVSVLGAKFRGEVPKVLGYSVLHIISDSMEPEIPRGAYILIQEVDAEKVEKGNVISFYSSDPTIYGLPNTHRVDNIIFEDGKRLFVTKGDANSMPDKAYVSGDKLIGIYVTDLSALSFLSRTMKGSGFFIMIIALQLIVVGMTVFTVIRKNDDKKAEKAEKAEKEE